MNNYSRNSPNVSIVHIPLRYNRNISNVFEIINVDTKECKEVVDYVTTGDLNGSYLSESEIRIFIFDIGFIINSVGLAIEKYISIEHPHECMWGILRLDDYIMEKFML